MFFFSRPTLPTDYQELDVKSIVYLLMVSVNLAIISDTFYASPSQFGYCLLFTVYFLLCILITVTLKNVYLWYAVTALTPATYRKQTQIPDSQLAC